MKIGINLLPLLPGKIGGMEQYIRNLIDHALMKDDEYQFFLFLSTQNQNAIDAKSSRIKKIILQEFIDPHWQMQMYMDAFKLDLWFCPLITLDPKNCKIPCVVTIPDLQHEFYPQFFDSAHLQWRNEQYPYAINHSDAILTLSEHAKSTIVDRYRIPENKVHAIHLDASQEFYSEYNEKINQQVVGKYQLHGEYGLYPANTWPHKNHINLLKALIILRDRYNLKLNIVFTGAQQQTQDSITTYIKENQLWHQIIFLGYLPQEDLPYVYRNAKFLVFPSLYEGFGIPLVEAMHTNTPVVCSNVCSIPEVVGDAALMFDPQNPEDIAQRLLEIQNVEIAIELVRKGRLQAQQFSWQKCCDSTLEVFKRVLSKSKEP